MRPVHAPLSRLGQPSRQPAKSASQPASFVAGGPSVSLPCYYLCIVASRLCQRSALLGMPACLLLYPESLPALSLAFCNAAQCRARGVCAAC